MSIASTNSQTVDEVTGGRLRPVTSIVSARLSVLSSRKRYIMSTCQRPLTQKVRAVERAALALVRTNSGPAPEAGSLMGRRTKSMA